MSTIRFATMSQFCVYALTLFACVCHVRSHSLQEQGGERLVRNKRSYKCTDYAPTHSMCVTERGTNQPLTDAEKKAILDKHNELRSGVNPPAENMQKLYWDDELAAIAAKWATQCKIEHDTGKNRRANSLPGTSIGQNLAWGNKDFVSAVNTWYSEVKDFKYGIGSVNDESIGHYTQVVLATASRVGCAKADCTGKMEGYSSEYACNYATGQTPTQMKKPYCIGAACAKCPVKDGKLCDCEGKVCFNGGTFDITTCSCKCYALFSGNQCEIKLCPATNSDYPGCTDADKKSYCEAFEVWGPAYCPFFCGLCP